MQSTITNYLYICFISAFIFLSGLELFFLLTEKSIRVQDGIYLFICLTTYLFISYIEHKKNLLRNV